MYDVIIVDAHAVDLRRLSEVKLALSPGLRFRAKVCVSLSVELNRDTAALVLVLACNERSGMR